MLVVGLATAGVKIQQAADRYFNPRGMSAISLTILDQVNVIRARLPTPLAAITTNQMLNAIDDKFHSIDPFTYETNNPYMRP